MSTPAASFAQEPNPGSDAVVSKGRIWTSRILFVLSVLFMLLDAVMKLIKPQQVVEASTKIGFPEASIVPIGVALLVSVIVYAIPRSAVFGAILLTGYLGGAVAANVVAKSPLFNVCFPLVFAVMIWAALVLRDKRLQRVIFG